MILLCILFITILPAISCAEFTTPEPEDLIIYQVFIDRFNNGDPSNDNGNPRGTYNPSGPWDFHGGDIEGIRKKLPYIRGMGFNAIWISPFIENVNDYHGYGAYDWYHVDPNFGDLAKLQQMVSEANDLGIAVYYDMVAGHCGNLIDSDDAGYPDYLPPPDEYNLKWRSGLKYPPPFDELNYFHAHGQVENFVSPEQELGEFFGLDDLRTDSVYVRDEMSKIWEYWIENTGVSGFRIDTVKHVDMGFWEYFLPRLRQKTTGLGRDNYFTFGEIYGAGDFFMDDYIGILQGSPYKLDAALDFQYYYASNDVFASGASPPSRIINRLLDRKNNLGFHHLMMPNFIDNHDVRRFLNICNDDNPSGRLKAALVFLMTAPGPPIVYYGTEQGFNGGSDPYNREDMFDGEFESGPSLGNNFNTASLHYQLIQSLTRIRSHLTPLRRGDLVPRINPTDGPGAFVFSRIHDSEEVVVMINTSGEKQNAELFSTSFTEGTILADFLNPDTEIVIGSEGAFSKRSLAAFDTRIFAPQNQLPPPAPLITSFIPANGDENVPMDARIELGFSVPMNTEVTSNSVTIDPVIPFSVSWNTEATSLTLSPNDPLESLTYYTVTIGPGARAQNGESLLNAGALARWKTARFGELPHLPDSFGVLRPSKLSIVCDGNGDEWKHDDFSYLPENSGVISSDNVFYWRDAEDDDLGYGTLRYPTAGVFTDEDADIVEFRTSFNNENLNLYLRPKSINPAAFFYTPYFGLVLDVKEGGHSPVLGYSQASNTRGVGELEIRPDLAMDFECVFTGPRGISLLDEYGQILTTGTLAAFSPESGEVEICLSRETLGLKQQLSGHEIHIIVYSALENNGTIREAEVNEGTWTVGGGSSLITDPDIFDLAGASQSQQLSDLQDFDEHLRSVILHSIITLHLDDEVMNPAKGWSLY